MDAPIGPTPYWMARIFFFTSLSVFRSHARTTRNFASKETPTIVEFRRAFNEEPLHAFNSLRRAPAKLAFLLAQRLRRIMAGENARRFRRNAPCQQKNFPTPRLRRLLPKAKGWSVVNGKLHREFTCKDFVAAFGNMTRVALVAESMNHHPEWSNVWNKVVIDLNTHSVKGISDYDFVLAEKINEIFA